MHETLILRSSVSSPLMRHVLFKGFSIAFVGILLLVLTGIYLPVTSLKAWGWLIFFFSLALIAWGLLPYRRLSRLQLKPDELIIANGDGLTYVSKGKKVLSFPLDSVRQISCINKPHYYGIAIYFKDSSHSPMTIYEVAVVEKLQRGRRKMKRGDLFFPYFNRRSYDELKDWIQTTSGD